jgi:L-alanine-DL-glutamate epimerase-like enolase superfamily enzyme
LHDLAGKLMGQPTWRVLGLADRTPETSYTIGIDSIEGTAGRAARAAAAGYRRLKVKLGGAGDLERLEAIRGVCDLPLRVDANEGWDVAEARELLPALVALGVELIEQPFPAGERDAFRELRAVGAGIPLVVDEGCHTLADVADVSTYADGVNLKLAKTGGIREAVRMVHAARALGLVVMLGCMIESSLGISAAGQFASLCDFVDLDGHLLISDDPCEGLGLVDGRIVLSQRPGLGVEPLR